MLFCSLPAMAEEPESVLEVYPDDFSEAPAPEGYAALADAVRSGSPEEVEPVLKEALSAGPSPHLYHLAGMLAWKDGRMRDAWRSFARAAGRRDGLTAARIMLAQVSIRNNDYSEAVGWLRKVLDDLPPEEGRKLLSHPVFDSLYPFYSFNNLLGEYGLELEKGVGEEKPRIVEARIRDRSAAPDDTDLEAMFVVALELVLTKPGPAARPKQFDVKLSPTLPQGQTAQQLRPRPPARRR